MRFGSRKGGLWSLPHDTPDALRCCVFATPSIDLEQISNCSHPQVSAFAQLVKSRASIIDKGAAQQQLYWSAERWHVHLNRLISLTANLAEQALACVKPCNQNSFNALLERFHAAHPTVRLWVGIRAALRWA
jgi:hypothetical protein